MNQHEWKPADHGMTAERVGTVIMALVGGLMLAGVLFVVFLLAIYIGAS
ncbi:hypothetical protein OG625_14200 [Streptomyces sp. NBC_01351]|nr:hypothetical protein [Streptomyces sp. NBC_01351]